MQKSREEKLALLRLYFAPGIGRVAARRLLEKFTSATEALLHLKNQEVEGVPQHLLANLYQELVIKKSENEFAQLEKHKIEMMTYSDPEYPPLLRHIPDPPAFLFFRGKFKDWKDPLPLAFVGTRHATDYGRRVVESLIEGLRNYSIVVISGFAKGIDSFAHQKALEVGLPTIGVLGTGLDYIYPAENERLYYSMLETGAFLSEYATSTPPHPGHFPERNRIISGLSKGVVVIEAPEKSGALITAEFAIEQGREVMTIPGSIFSSQQRGCHRLISQGAKLVEKAEDILAEFKLAQSRQTAFAQNARPPLEPDEENLFQTVNFEPLHIDKITEISNLAPSLVAGGLTSLVLKGLVQELPGKYFVRN